MFYRKKFHTEIDKNRILENTQGVSANDLLIRPNFDKIPN